MTATPEPLTVAWPAVPASVSKARETVRRYLRTAETSDPPLSDVVLVVSEAVTNSVHHAYGDGPPGDVRVALHIGASELELVVEDDGRGMAPRPDTPGLGLGLPLIATLAERFDTHSAPDRGTRLCVWFSRHPGAATLPEQG